FHAADFPLARTPDELARLAPAECLCGEKDEAAMADLLAKISPAPARTARPDWTFELRSAHETLHRHFAVAGMDGFGFDKAQPCLVAAGALLCYAQEMLKTGLDHIRGLKPYVSSKILQLDLVARRSLELTRTLREGERDGSLLAALDRTATRMGARLLHDWLLAPLAERDAIEQRLDAVGELMENRALRDELRQILADVHD